MTSKRDILRPKCRLGKEHPDEDWESPEEDLTIGIGFRCSDGIVLAGDCFRKKGDFGTSVTKVRSFRFRKNPLGAMVGAGTSRYIDPTFDRFNDALKDSMGLKEARLTIDNERRRLYEEDMERSADENNGEPHFSFLLALWGRKDGVQLLSGTSDAPTSIVDESYKAIGKGAPLARCLVETFYSLEGTCEEAALISVMVLKLVKGFVEGCEGKTNIIAVMENGLFRPKSSHAVKEVEDSFVGFFGIVRQMLSNLVLRDDPDEFYGRESDKLRTDLQNFVYDRHQSPFLVRRFPREKKAKYPSQG